MIEVAVRDGADLDGFRMAVRRLVAAKAAPEQVAWTTRPTLFAGTGDGTAPPVRLPRALGELVPKVLCHRDPERFGLLYAAIWRTLHGEPRLIEVASDPVVHRLERMAKAVRRDIHKMHAFVRFRRVDGDGPEQFAAWFEPENFILEAAAPFFVDRFRAMRWTIVTPIGSLHWEGRALVIGPAGRREDAPQSDPFEAGWLGYYESTFNPARVNPAQMRAEMPKRYWRNLPEAAAIADLVRTAPERARAMQEREAATPRHRNPERAVAAMVAQTPDSLEMLNRIIAAAPPMVEGGTRAVLGEGPVGASIAFVGEQPGDQEDLQGRPFVGPAGQVFDRLLAEVGIDRRAAYVTNAVKHFKFAQRGKRRLHQSPTAGEVKHYRWWLQTELALVRPRLVVALGATAALALSGRAVSVTAERGETQFEGGPGYITVHPSYLLRLPDPDAQAAATAALRDDLARVRALAA